MDIFGVLSLIGGLAIFLYGMDLLGEGLTGASGGKLEKILEKLTSNPLKASWCWRNSSNTVILSHNSYGCRLCEFWYYEA